MKSDLVVRDAEAFFRQKGSSPCRSALRAVQGIWLEEIDGRRLIDLHGNTSHHLGYGHPELIAALKTQLDDLPFCPRRFTNEPAVGLAEKLLDKWPGDPAKVLFATGGSDGIEIALKLARAATGRHETISFEDSYHGHGFGAFGLSSSATDARLGPLLPGRHHVPGYWSGEDAAEHAVEAIRRITATSAGGIAAVIAEPIRSNCHVPPDWFWPEIGRLCRQHGSLLIFDEIPSGLGKTGRFFAFEHVGVVPDMVVLGKALGGGIVPISAVIADARLDVAPELALGHYTHEKNPLTTRAGLTTIELIERHDLVARAAALGERVIARVAEIGRSQPVVRQARGKGLLLAIEFDPSHYGRKPGSEFAHTIVSCALDEGLSTTAKDAVSFGFSPPLTIADDELKEALARVERTAHRVAKALS